MDSFERLFFRLQNEKRVYSTNTYCTYQSWRLSLISIMPYVLGWMSGFLAILMESEYGPRTIMMFSSLMVVVGGLLSILTIKTFAVFMMGRIIIGIGMGVWRQVALIYITEVPPMSIRTTLDIAYEICVKFGMIFGNVIIFLCDSTKYSHGMADWKRVNLVTLPMVILGVLFGLGSYIALESPKYMMMRSNNRTASDTILEINEGRQADAQIEYDRLGPEVEELRRLGRLGRVDRFREIIGEIIRRLNIPHLRIRFISIVLQSLLGSSKLISFLSDFLEGIGLEDNQSLWSSVAAGIVSMMAILLSVWLISVGIGRRKILLVGCYLVIIGQCFFGILIVQIFRPLYSKSNVEYGASISFLALFVFGAELINGPLGWLSQRYPSMTQMPGSYLSRNTNLSLEALLSHLFIYTMCYVHGWLFVVFDVASMGMGLFIYIFVPETTGLSIDQMTDVWRAHPYWRRFV